MQIPNMLQCVKQLRNHLYINVNLHYLLHQFLLPLHTIIESGVIWNFVVLGSWSCALLTPRSLGFVDIGAHGTLPPNRFGRRRRREGGLNFNRREQVPQWFARHWGRMHLVIRPGSHAPHSIMIIRNVPFRSCCLLELVARILPISGKT